MRALAVVKRQSALALSVIAARAPCSDLADKGGRVGDAAV